MYFIFELEFFSKKNYIANLIRGYIKKENMTVDVIQSTDLITMVFNKDDERINEFLLKLENILPASLFLGQGKHYFADEKPIKMPLAQENLPLNIAPCPSCQKEMFDVSSRRYYYPLTSCNNCGTQYPFLNKYPYNRQNSNMKFITPCENCSNETKTNFLRLNYPLISCIDCGIVIRMLDKENEHLALSKGDLRKLFEVSANAINSNKSVLMKTMHGYRKFFKPTKETPLKDSILFITDANSINNHLMIVPQEFNALLSIERPLLRVATKSRELKKLYGSSLIAKYPDDGMSMLLARELLNAKCEYIAYIECDNEQKADFFVDFDMPISPQKDTKIFINQDKKFFINGERIIFPYRVKKNKKTKIANNLGCVKNENIIDSLNILNINEDEAKILGNDFTQYESSMMSVIAEYGKKKKKLIGVHFDGDINFLFYNTKKVINVIPSIFFDSSNLWDKISTLRDGSNRLVDNYKKAYPNRWERLNNLKGNMDIFEVSAISLGLKDESLEGISASALSFLGKGGLQIDTKIKDNYFDNYAFLTSIMSYQLGDVDNSLMCYSIYESFGDYIGEIVEILTKKTKTNMVVLTGESFANQSLYARIKRSLKQYKILMNKDFPIGKENAIYGAIHL